MSSEAQHAEERVVDTPPEPKRPPKFRKSACSISSAILRSNTRDSTQYRASVLFKGWLRKTVDAADLTPGK